MDIGVIEEIVNSIKEEPQDTNTIYSAEVAYVDGDGRPWVYLAGSTKETPVERASTEVKSGDYVNVEWRNNKLYIAGNYSNPSAGVQRVVVVENTADTALHDANIAHEAATSAVQSAATAGRAASAAQSAAEAAQATADIKKRVFTAQPVPPYNVGDLWVDLGSADYDLVTSAGDVLVDDQANALIAAVLGTGSETVVYVSTFARTAEEAYTASDWSLAATDDAKVDELREWFWHDSLGAHVLGDATGYRNDITSTGMQIMDTSTETSVATFGASGAQIGKSGDINAEVDASGFTVNSPSGTDVAHLGYGSVVMSDGTTSNGPFYTLGMRLTGAVGYDSMVIGAGKATKFQSVGMCGGEANGERSIACGTSVLADSDNQAVFGIFNESDANNTYAFIIGNGSGVSNRSNAFAVDWNGNIYPAGVKMTDFVIDEGTSGSWTYRKWHSGKIEAWFEGSFNCAASTTAQGALYYSTWSLTIPSAIGFTSAPNTLIGNTGDSTTVIAVNGAATSATAMSGNVWRYASSSSALTISARIYAWQN